MSPDRPRTGLGESAAPPAATPPLIAGLLLAAGQSQRMAADNKLLAEVGGRPLVAWAADALRASGAAPLILITGFEAEQVRAAVGTTGFVEVHNTDFASGLAGSLKRGIAALPPEVDGVVICLGDMPRITAQTIDRLIAFFEPSEGRAICLPAWRGQRGNPVLLGRQFFREIAAVSGDVGAKNLIGRYPALVCEVPMEDDSVLIDVDTPEALDALRREGG